VTLRDRLRRLEGRAPAHDAGSSARERLLAKLNDLAERRRQAGIPDRALAPGELDAIMATLRTRAREAMPR